MIHVYGLIVGIAIAVGWWLVEYQVKQAGIKLQEFQMVAWLILIFGLIGARLWHVMTDWSLYSHNLLAIFKVWQGGLSILGAIAGGLWSLWLTNQTRQQFWHWLDWIALALPISQAIGRLANFVNQELYGQPSDLPWAITIDYQHRLPGFEQVATYHPLFLYEAILLLSFAGLMWWLVKTNHHQRISQRRPLSLNLHQRLYRWQQVLLKRPGSMFTCYLMYYSLIRFWLDFLRLSVTPVWWRLGFNQVVMVIVFFGVIGWWWQKLWAKIITIVWIGLILISFLSLRLGLITKITSLNIDDWPHQWLVGNRLHLHDHSFYWLQVGDQQLKVELVNSPTSIAHGLSDRSILGSDGMLFILPKRMVTQFWMPNMQFDLDIVWIDCGTVVGIETNVPHPLPGTDRTQLKLYPSPQVVEWVLEVGAGQAVQWNWQVGDKVRLLPDEIK